MTFGHPRYIVETASEYGQWQIVDLLNDRRIVEQSPNRQKLNWKARDLNRAHTASLSA